ncbi:sporulation integral membrane protein YlbJ [Haloimpatiens sp. FM7330]|uniref:sporulation integral membrane protein YlbJ n=1 Tax=Haloimpatiens sp. FM7330 TaxID=3298610 RepID=UPI003632EA85
MILNPKLCINSTLNGTKIFFNSVFTSLFPFLVITNIILQYDGIEIYSNLLGKSICSPLNLSKECSFPIVISFICGYPLGAKYTCDLYEQKIIDRNTCERLLNIASNASPMFVIGAIGTSMLKNKYLGYLLLISHYISCILMAIVLKSKNKQLYMNSSPLNKNYNKSNIGKILKSSIENAIHSSLSIGGFIILFSIITTLLKQNLLFNMIIKLISNMLNSSYNFISSLFIGSIEMTNGCYLISSTSCTTITKLIVISFLISFSGLSIICQVYSFSCKFHLSIKKYIIRKLIQGILCSIITSILYIIVIFKTKIPVFYTMTTYTKAYNTNFAIAMCYILLMTPYVLAKAKKLFHIF